VVKDAMGEEDAKETIGVVKYFRSYYGYKALQRLNLTMSINEFSFEKVLMWAWIEEFLSGRKT
jgi:hypothetical protein